MPSKLSQRIIRLTVEQEQALEKLLSTTGETFNNMVRRKLKEEAESNGIVWPENMPTWGGRRVPGPEGKSETD